MKLRATFLTAVLVASLFTVAPGSTSVGTAEASSTTPVIQDSSLTPAQIAGFFHANTKSPYNATVPVEFLAAYYIAEGNAEGVAGDIAFAQAILETGWFSFPSTGQVRGSDNNFAGMGAYDGADGQWVFRFPTARIGVRAQLQHLRIYSDPSVNSTGTNMASPIAEDLEHRYPDRWRWVRNSKTGSTYNYWARAQNWEDFGGGMWATDTEYSTKILNLYSRMRAFADANPHLKDTWLFSDVKVGSTHENDIIAIAISGITRGCGDGRYCPGRDVTREEMASFMRRALDLPATDTHYFSDVPKDSTHVRDVNALRAAGITMGCNPPANDRFCPKDPVKRDQMAAFMSRALDLKLPTTSTFTDVRDGSTFDRQIGAIAEAGITKGCNPPTNSRYCPDRSVSRAEMASFLHRAGLAK